MKKSILLTFLAICVISTTASFAQTNAKTLLSGFKKKFTARQMRITNYCSCSKCCGKYAFSKNRKTSDGLPVGVPATCATAHKGIWKRGTVFDIHYKSGKSRRVIKVDSGAGPDPVKKRVKGKNGRVRVITLAGKGSQNWIDVYSTSHSAALKAEGGIAKVDVYEPLKEMSVQEMMAAAKILSASNTSEYAKTEAMACPLGENAFSEDKQAGVNVVLALPNARPNKPNSEKAKVMAYFENKTVEENQKRDQKKTNVNFNKAKLPPIKEKASQPVANKLDFLK